jgi:hypothetical protein
MIRLPDTYYTQQMLDGNPPQNGPNQLAPIFSQGEDIVFSTFLNVDGLPLDPTKWEIEFMVKKNVYASNILFKGELGESIIPLNNTPGFFQLWIPARATADFLPGLYYLSVSITEKTGTGKGIKDRHIFLMNTVFNIELSAASPHPKLRPVNIVEISFDNQTGITTSTTTNVEPTVPFFADTGAGPSGGVSAP